MATAVSEAFAVLSINDRIGERRAEQEEPQDRTYVQVRRELDIGAFGASAVQAEGGQDVVSERTASGYGADRHEELFVVLRGGATFTVDGEEIEAAEGAAIFVRDPDAKRKAVATEDGTTILVVGGRRGVAWRPTPGEAMSEFFPQYEAKDYEAALRVAEQVLDEYEGNGLAHYNIACMQSLLGRSDEAIDHLRAALDANPELLENAQKDEDFAPIRDDPRFAELVPSDRV